MNKITNVLFTFILILSFWSMKVDGITLKSGDIPLEVETYLAGKNQLTHPSLISFDKQWNGYKYWMVYTPYPYANGEEENPSIAVSNDMYKWTTPKGLANPIANNEETGCNELKDGHILYRDDLDRLEVWYLGRLDTNLSNGKYDENQLLLFRKYSYDGIHWSTYEVMKDVDYLCPSVIWKDGKYKLWHIGYDTYNTTGKIEYIESSDGYNWDNQHLCSVNSQLENIKIWHGSVVYNKNKNIYEMVYIDDGGKNNSIFYCDSKDGIHFSKPKSIIQISDEWDRFYRPNLIYIDNTYYAIYGVVSKNNEWYLSMSSGNSLDQLKGINENDKNIMIGLSYPELNVSFIENVKIAIHNSKEYIRYEIYLFPLIILAIVKIFKLKNKNSINVMNIVFVLSYLLFRFHLNFNLEIFISSLFMMITEMIINLFIMQLPNKNITT